MANIVLTFDPSLGHQFHNFPLLSFLPCAPVKYVPPPVYYYLSKPDVPFDESGRAILATYGVRKVEACLFRRTRYSVVVAHPYHLDKHINSETKIIGINTMDPLGIGPLTLMFNNAGKMRSWVTEEFLGLMRSVNVLRKERCPKAKVVVGGAGVWEFEMLPWALDRLGIDHAIEGEIDDVAHLLFEQIIEDSIDTSVFMFGHKSTTFDVSGRPRVRYLKDSNGRFITRNPFSRYKIPRVEEIPTIINPTISGQAEIMRGCGLDCDFCEVTTRPLRYYPPEKVLEEVKVNLRGGLRHAWFITDNQWAYMLKDKDYWPNKEAIFDLYRTVLSYNGVTGANPMHATLAPVAADPELAFGVAKLVRAGPNRHIGVQIGLETGSDKLVKMHAWRKALPLKVGVDCTWAELVVEAQKAYNAAYWIPAYTIILGMVGETDEDLWDTIGLINHMASLNLYFTVTPMALVSLGSLKGENKLTDVYASMTPSQAALIYVCWRNTKRMAELLTWRLGKENPIYRALTASVLTLGARIWLSAIKKFFFRFGPEYERAIDKAERYSSIKTMGTDFWKLREQYKKMAKASVRAT
ncbi:MAG: B12-binding domain-containing radical SAM protein [Thaumarchaeota archaeon]|nr:B12-binding domain-containing radical SAM protein [Candidatus Calditenuaceae archaeon]MDW8187477.1 radical SAM protein [Nitrososphaerota archaeon]